MVYRKKNIPPGPKSVFNRSLGVGVQAGQKFPQRVNELLKSKPIKRLLNWMAMDENFKEKILSQVPDEDPPEPEKP